MKTAIEEESIPKLREGEEHMKMPGGSRRQAEAEVKGTFDKIAAIKICLKKQVRGTIVSNSYGVRLPDRKSRTLRGCVD